MFEHDEKQFQGSRLIVLIGCILSFLNRLPAAEIIDPSGANYSEIQSSSEYSPAFSAAQLFNRDVTGIAPGLSLTPDSDWAISGTGPAYLRFQLDDVYQIASIFYAQRTGAVAGFDKVNRISIWTSVSNPFSPNDPGSLPKCVMTITNQQSAIWSEYALPEILTGRYFLLKFEQTPIVGGNIGGGEFRFGAAPADHSAPALAYVSPAPGAVIHSLHSVEIGFSEPVEGVDANDLLINGEPASEVTPLSPSQFLFTFPQPDFGNVNVGWSANAAIHDFSETANPFSGAGWSYMLETNAVGNLVYISEFMASNSGDQPDSLKDELGNAPDWIEIHNASDEAADLTGWFLTDNANRLTHWKFPVTLIPANGYLIVFASDRNTNVAGQLHTDFKLSAGGSFLALVDPQTNIVSSFAPEYPPQQTDVSYGRDRLDPQQVGFFASATPGAPNDTLGSGWASDVIFSRSGGTFLDNFELNLSVADPDSEIRYVIVTNNVPQASNALVNIPTESSTLYTGPIVVSKTMQVRARAFPKSSGRFPGAPRTESFIRLSSQAANFTSGLPIILIHNLGGGLIPAGRDQNAIVMVFEPTNGVASMTNSPSLVTRAGINLRGLSTAGFPKSSFAVETWDEFNEDRDVEFCGLPAESDWVLYAPNSFDIPLIHNPLIHQISRELGRYASRTRFAEVFVNQGGGNLLYAEPAGGNYNGIYVVEEKVKRGKNRVDVEKLEPGATALPEISGGYIFKCDAVDPDEVAFSAGGLGKTYQVYVYPDGPEMVSPIRAAQNDFFLGKLNALYTALHSLDWTNPVTGYAQFFDVDAGIDHHLLNVLALNVDAFRISGYAHIPRNGKITMGPIWDFDRAFGASRLDDRPFNPRLWRGIDFDNDTDFFNASVFFNNAWYARLFQDPDFWQKYIDRYQELRADLWSTNHLFALVDELADQVRSAQPREVARWGGSNGSDTSPRYGVISANGYSYNFGFGSYQTEIDFLKTWLNDRLNFIDTNFLARPVFTRTATASNTVVLNITIPPKTGSIIFYTTNGVDPRLPGGGISPSARTYGGPITISQNSRITARVRNLTHHNFTGPNSPPLSSSWSGINSEVVLVQPISIAITEIMYHPGDLPTGTNAAADCEFMELKNIGATPCSLIGLQFTNGIQFTFTSTNAITNLAPGEYVLLVKNRSAFLERYPGVTNIAGEYSGSLDNSGERLQLVGPLGEIIADFRYEDFWYPDTDGNGASLVAVNENGPASEMQNADFWRPSSSAGGSPGSGDPENPFALDAAIQNDQISLTFAASAGRSYTLQTAEDVRGPWQNFLNVPSTSTNRVLKIDDDLDSARRFYRIISSQQP